MLAIKINKGCIPVFHIGFFSIYELSNIPHSVPRCSLEKILFIFHVCIISV